MCARARAHEHKAKRHVDGIGDSKVATHRSNLFRAQLRVIASIRVNLVALRNLPPDRRVFPIAKGNDNALEMLESLGASG